METSSQIEQALKVSYDATLGGSGSVDQDGQGGGESRAVLAGDQSAGSGGQQRRRQQRDSDRRMGTSCLPTPIPSAVPLRYVVRNLNGTRPVARLGDTTNFTVAECMPYDPTRPTGWVAVEAPVGVEFLDISSQGEEELGGRARGTHVRGLPVRGRHDGEQGQPERAQPGG